MAQPDTEASRSPPMYWRRYRQLPGKSEFFPSDDSLRWFIRCHEAELVREGALIRHLRKPMIIVDPFDRVVIEIATRQAKHYAEARDDLPAEGKVDTLEGPAGPRMKRLRPEAG